MASRDRGSSELMQKQLEALRGDQAGRHSMRVNDQYRVTFRSENGHAYEVAVLLVAGSPKGSMGDLDRSILPASIGGSTPACPRGWAGALIPSVHPF